MTKNSKSSPARKKTSGIWNWLLGGAVVLFLSAALFWFASVNTVPRVTPNTNSMPGMVMNGNANTNSNANANPYANPSDIAANLANSQNAFSVGTRVGKPAPAFTLSDAQGKPYKFQPGDGKKYVFAFNMGYS